MCFLPDTLPPDERLRCMLARSVVEGVAASAWLILS
jgi:hypothetical protein